MSEGAAVAERHSAVPFWRDERILKMLGQIVFMILVIAVAAWMISNYLERGLTFSFAFLNEEASFDLAEGLPFSPTDSYARAFLVGVVNTVRVAGLGIIFATLLGLVAGIARLSDNWLVNRIASVYIEIIRNTPLLVQLFFLYFAVILKLPALRDAIEFSGPIYFSNRGVAFPALRPTPLFGFLWPFLLAALIGALVLLFIRGRTVLRTGRPAFNLLWVAVPLVVLPAIGWQFTPGNPLVLDPPELVTMSGGVLRIVGGTTFSPEFTALLFGLVIYTGAFIAEVVRAGILAVPKGQTEAARAQGFTQGQILRLIVLPQALRVIIPPLISQYLNLTKNSSLALGIGFLDLYAVSNTMLNQSGRVVEVFIMIMASYLSMSLTISLIMNIINRRIQIVER
ncbi:MAG: ABC transporter permease subunit [Anaerolineales bacterium]|nr:ABC transporter permease subunit [Anaerolineales bacterium]